MAANAYIRAARAAFFPTVQLTASGGWQALRSARCSAPARSSSRPRPAPPRPIFDNGAVERPIGAGARPATTSWSPTTARRCPGLHRRRERADRLPLRHRAGGPGARRGGHRPARRRHRPRPGAGRHQRHRHRPCRPRPRCSPTSTCWPRRGSRGSRRWSASTRRWAAAGPGGIRPRLKPISSRACYDGARTHPEVTCAAP